MAEITDEMTISPKEEEPMLVEEVGNSTISTSTEEGKGEVSQVPKADEKEEKGKPSSAVKNENTEEDEILEEEIGPDSVAQPVQICSVGTIEDKYAFTFHDERLNMIMQKIPPGWKVSVVSVVGAFRTGKSFLLSWFLRYLNYHSSSASSKIQGDQKDDDGKMWYDQFDSLGQDGFHWRGGFKRDTTGLWMWSHPYFLKRNLPDGSTEDIAVVLLDTQGMFDHDTTMKLAASIFGLSTLLSSYQIYNVDKKIQEDNLQQLALFSEYGRRALQVKNDAHENDNQVEKEPSSNQAADKEGNGVEKLPEETHIPKPFQKIEFLVRDWQNFEDEDEIDQCEKEMEKYLEEVLAEKSASDLKDTRDQITSCFDEITCYMFTHPGNKVTRQKYKGEVKDMDSAFFTFLKRYCQRVFDANNLVPKSIHGRELTASELGAYIKAYASMFSSGADFPKAATMLEATANANNSNAINLSVQKYKEQMDKFAGPRVDQYTQPEEFKRYHKKYFDESILVFKSIANFGSTVGIEKARTDMETSINNDYEIYSKLNDNRNPLAGLEIYIIPITIALLSLLVRWVVDTTCSSRVQVCRAGSDALTHLYQVVLFFLLIIAATKAQQIAAFCSKFKSILQALTGNGSHVSNANQNN